MTDQQDERHDDREENERIEDREPERRSHQMKLAQASQYSHLWGM
jgi:hypothetical protein